MASRRKHVERPDVPDVVMLVDAHREVLALCGVAAKELETPALLLADADELAELVACSREELTSPGPKAVVHMDAEHAAEVALLVVNLEDRRREPALQNLLRECALETATTKAVVTRKARKRP